MPDFDALIPAAPSQNAAFGRLVDIIRVLRSPEGCPWDREQTPSSMRPALVEEAYEIIDAIDHGESEHIREELGDLYLVVSMISYMYEQKEVFDLTAVLNDVSDKLVRRHPHVFGDVEVADSNEVLKNWEEIKVDVEGKKRKDGTLHGIPLSLPPLERAYKLQRRAAKAGFDWATPTDVLPKLREEIGELEAELADENPDALENELGDLLFSVVNLARKLRIDPSQALNRANRKFTTRYEYVERKMTEQGTAMAPDTLDTMEAFWSEAKRTLES